VNAAWWGIFSEGIKSGWMFGLSYWQGGGLMKKKRKVGRKPIQESWTYCMEILDWEMSYFFSLPPKIDIVPGPFWEGTSLKIKGRLFQPEKYADRLITIDINGDRRLVPVMFSPENHDYEPKAVGELTIRGKQSEFLGWVPFDILQSLILLLHGGKINFLILSGLPLYRGTADIKSIHFEKDYRAEDWM
jgi:hypothetical protein